MPGSPLVSIVIVNWNGAGDTIECVDSILKITYPNFQIIVIDNGSDDRDVKRLTQSLQDHVNIVLLRRNLGFAIANNVGIRISIQHGAEFVLLLNNDTTVDPRFLSEMVSAAQSDPSIGIVGCKVILYDDKERLWYAGGKLNMYLRHKTEGLFKLDLGQFDFDKETDYVTGACMLVRTEVFKRIGLLPREYFLGWEDIDFCVAARKNGFNCLYVARSRIWHKSSSSYKRHNLGYLQVFLGFRNRVMMRHKYLSVPKFLLFLIIQFVIIIPVHAVYYLTIYRDSGRINHMLRGIANGLKDMRTRKIKYSI